MIHFNIFYFFYQAQFSTYEKDNDGVYKHLVNATINSCNILARVKSHPILRLIVKELLKSSNFPMVNFSNLVYLKLNISVLFIVKTLRPAQSREDFTTWKTLLLTKTFCHHSSHLEVLCLLSASCGWLMMSHRQSWVSASWLKLTIQKKENLDFSKAEKI